MSDIQAQFDNLRTVLNKRHYERYDEIEIAIASALTGYHAVLIGPPGTGKSMLIEDMTQVFTGASLFKYLLTKYTVPEELYGPWNLPLLKEGRYERVIDGKAAQAHFIYFDEIFKSNAAVLNTNLTVMNERMFDQGTTRIPVPLISLWGASNEMPESEELGALFDRFQFRIIVDYITEPQNFISMIKAPEEVELPEISLDDLYRAQQEINNVEIPEGLYDVLYQIRADLEIDGIIPSDRRFKQATRALKAMAWLAPERDNVTDDDFRIMEHMLWSTPQEVKRVARVIRKHTNPLEIKVQEIMDAIDEIAGKLHQEITQARQKNVDPKQVLVKQGIDWFAQCKTLGKQLGGLVKQAKKEKRPTNRILQTRDRLLRVMKEIGRHTIGVEGFDLDLET